MQTILLFSRCELTNLYGRIGPKLSKSHNIIHIAYSNEEEKILCEKFGIENIINFKAEIKNIYDKESYDEVLISEIDNNIIKASQGRFTLNAAIQYDRTFRDLDYKETLILAQVYYKFWIRVIDENDVNFILHEPTSLFLNHIASILCELNNSNYITAVQVYGESRINFAIASGDTGIFKELAMEYYKYEKSKASEEKVKNFLKNFRLESENFFHEYTKKTNSAFNLFAFTSIRILKILLKYLNSRVKLISRNYALLDHVELFHLKEVKPIKQIRNHFRYYYILKYDKYDEKVDYFYYPLHLEPEAVVLYWGDGIYNNQVKLIENIAAHLPPSTFLYIKDHPHAGAYRDYDDYRKIKSIPNIKLIDPSIPGKKLISGAMGIVTINGTSGFEALLMNKPVYTFGNAYYNLCERVHFIKNIRDFGSILYANKDLKYFDDKNLFRFVSSYLKSTHEGFTDYFINYPKLIGIDEEENAEIVAKGLIDYLENCKSFS